MSTTIFNGHNTSTTTFNGSNNYIISDLGHITVANGDALIVEDTATVFVNGGIYASKIGIRVNGTGNKLEIGEDGTVIAVSDQQSSPAWGIYIDGKVEQFVNKGYIDANGPGVVLWSSPSKVVFDNYGQVSGDSGIWGVTSEEVVINNHHGGVIQGDVYGIEQSTSQAGPVTVVNDGYITGGNAAISVFGLLTLTNNGVIDGKVGSVTGVVTGKGAVAASSIENFGEMNSGADGIAITLGTGNDVVKNKGTIEGSVHLGGGRDRFKSNEGDDEVYAEAGKDTIKTRGGNDTIDPGTGKDKIKPGKGNDLLVFAKGYGKDTVKGFKPGKDLIDLSDHGFNGFGDLKSVMTQKGSHLHIDLAGADKIVLKNVHTTDLSADDFVL